MRHDHAFVALFAQFENLSALIVYEEVGWAPVGTFVWRGDGSRNPEYRPVSIQPGDEIDRVGEGLALLKAGAFGGLLARVKDAKTAYESQIEQSSFG